MYNVNFTDLPCMEFNPSVVASLTHLSLFASVIEGNRLFEQGSRAKRGVFRHCQCYICTLKFVCKKVPLIRFLTTKPLTGV